MSLLKAHALILPWQNLRSLLATRKVNSHNASMCLAIISSGMLASLAICMTALVAILITSFSPVYQK